MCHDCVVWCEGILNYIQFCNVAKISTPKTQYMYIYNPRRYCSQKIYARIVPLLIKLACIIVCRVSWV